jgi:hypothetical protein
VRDLILLVAAMALFVLMAVLTARREARDHVAVRTPWRRIVATVAVGGVFVVGLAWYLTPADPSQRQSGIYSQLAVQPAYQPPPPASAACDKPAGQVRLDAMIASSGAAVSEADGWVVVQIGSAYAEWTPERSSAWVRLYADGDACVAGRARRLEFQDPSGRVFARVDEVRGIRML